MERDARFNGLTPAEDERLALAVEEMGESLQVLGKIMRHGWRPTDRSVSPAREYDNRADLERELGQVMHAVWLMCESGDLSPEELNRHMKERKATIRQYLHHQPKS